MKDFTYTTNVYGISLTMVPFNMYDPRDTWDVNRYPITNEIVIDMLNQYQKFLEQLNK
jgi:hypothetical protein